MKKRFGLIETFVLLEVYAQGVRGIDRMRRDRSQIVFSLYCAKNNLIDDRYRNNVKKAMSAKKYSVLQSSVSRSIRALEGMDLIQRVDFALGGDQELPSTLRRKYSFTTTSAGRAKAKIVLAGMGLHRKNVSRRAYTAALFSDR